MSGLTAEGFERKRLVDIKADLEDALKSVFGENIDTTPQSGFGQFIGIISEAISDQWQALEDIYNSQYPSTSQGNQLSNVVMYNGIERQAAAKSTVTLTITGTAGTIIPVGSKAAVISTGEKFVTLSEVIIPISGTVTVESESENYGAITGTAGTVTIINTPIFGWTAVNNVFDAIIGRDEETDAELRIRREVSTQTGGQNLVDSLYGQLLNIVGVSDALVLSNGLDTTSPEGIPPHQFLSVVLGGAAADIAETIWVNTPQGIMSYGAVTEIITDAQGFPQDVKFSRPTSIPIYFKISITTDSDFPGAGSDAIKNAVVDYGTDNFRISDDVILSKFYTPINLVPGVISIDLRLGLAPSPSGTSNIVIDFDEVSTYSITNVEVLIV